MVTVDRRRGYANAKNEAAKDCFFQLVQLVAGQTSPSPKNRGFSNERLKLLEQVRGATAGQKLYLISVIVTREENFLKS